VYDTVVVGADAAAALAASRSFRAVSTNSWSVIWVETKLIVNQDIRLYNSSLKHGLQLVK